MAGAAQLIAAARDGIGPLGCPLSANAGPRPADVSCGPTATRVKKPDQLTFLCVAGTLSCAEG